MSRAMGWTCDSEPNAISATLKHAFAWWSPIWWQNPNAHNLRDDPSNHTRWKHKWSWQNRECVWRRVASEWSGKSVLSHKMVPNRRGQDFVTFASMRFTHSVPCSPNIGERSKPNKERKERRQSGPPCQSICIRTEGASVQMGDRSAAELWIIGFGCIQKTLHSCGRKNVVHPVTQIDDDVTHICREHNQEEHEFATVRVLFL